MADINKNHNVIFDECEFCKVVETPKSPEVPEIPDDRKYDEIVIRFSKEKTEVLMVWPLEEMTSRLESFVLGCITDDIMDEIELDDLNEWLENDCEVLIPLNTELKFRIWYPYLEEEPNKDDADSITSACTPHVKIEDLKNLDELKLAFHAIDKLNQTYGEDYKYWNKDIFQDSEYLETLKYIP